MKVYPVKTTNFTAIAEMIKSKCNTGHRRRVSVLHMHGQVAGRSPLPPLFQAVLLPVHPALVGGAALAVPTLPPAAAAARARQLPLGRRHHPAA